MNIYDGLNLIQNGHHKRFLKNWLTKSLFDHKFKAYYVYLTKTDYKVISSAFLGDERNVVSKKKKPNDSTSKDDMAELNKNCNGADDEVDYTKTSKQVKKPDVNKRQILQTQLTSNISTLNI